MADYNNPGEFPAYAGAPPAQYTDYQQYQQAYGQPPPREKTHEEKIQEKARKWQQLQNKRYGEKRKFGKNLICARQPQHYN